jgi:hypothetical protein
MTDAHKVLDGRGGREEGAEERLTAGRTGEELDGDVRGKGWPGFNAAGEDVPVLTVSCAMIAGLGRTAMLR